MDRSYLAPGLSELRRELEEILALLSRDFDDPPAHRKPSITLAQIKPVPDHQPVKTSEPPDSQSATVSEGLFDDALVVITEFGQATPGILQMWLSIDYAEAARILRRFEDQGLVSTKGRVRHKAYELRRTVNKPTSMEMRT